MIERIKTLIFLDEPHFMPECERCQWMLRHKIASITHGEEKNRWIIVKELKEIEKMIIRHRKCVQDKISTAVQEYKNVYIYGTGKIASFVSALIDKIGADCSYVVSDNQYTGPVYQGRMVLRLNSIKINNSENIFLLAVGKRHIKEIIHSLKDRGHVNYDILDLDILL